MIELWIPITIAAAFCQNLRSALQKHLTSKLSTSGATFIRFFYAVVPAWLYVWFLHDGVGLSMPEPQPEFCRWNHLFQDRDSASRGLRHRHSRRPADRRRNGRNPDQLHRGAGHFCRQAGHRDFRHRPFPDQPDGHDRSRLRRLLRYLGGILPCGVAFPRR